MNCDNNALTVELHKLVELGRIIRLVPDIVRARVLARARASVDADTDLASPGPGSLSARARLRGTPASTRIIGIRDRW
jgi:hypothetical protein